MGSGSCERTAVETVLRRQLSKKTQHQKSVVGEVGGKEGQEFSSFLLLAEGRGT